MELVFTRLTAFVGRHWLRIGLLGGALILLSQKQVDFKVQLGHPDAEGTPAAAPYEPTAPVAEDEPLLLSDHRSVLARAGGFFSRFNIFGGGTAAPDRADRLALRGDAAVRAYLERFTHVAQAEQAKFGVPASVHLAAGLLYSEAGQAAPVHSSNSYFGLRCTADWAGPTGQSAGQCLRAYETAWAAHRDFSVYVTSGEFGRMRQFGPQDYRRWARGLEELGLHGETGLAEQLVRVIEAYGLQRYD